MASCPCVKNGDEGYQGNCERSWVFGSIFSFTELESWISNQIAEEDARTAGGNSGDCIEHYLYLCSPRPLYEIEI